MAFDMFTQPQGVNVPISIWGDAKAQGTAIGKQVPNTWGAIAEGLNQGIQNAQTTYSNQQKIQETALDMQIKQQAIEMQPLRQEALKQQMEAQQLELEDNKLKLQNSVATNGQELENKKAQLTNSTAAFEEQTKLRTDKDNFLSTFANSDPLTKKQMLLGGQYAGLLAKDTELFKQAAASIPDRFLSADEQKQLRLVIGKNAILDSYSKDLPGYEKAARESKASLVEDKFFSDAAVAAKLSPNLAIDQLDIVPNGRQKVDPLTQKRIRGEKGGYVPTEGIDFTKTPTTYDIFAPDDTLVAAGVPAATYSSWAKYKKSVNLLNGSYRDQDINHLEKVLGVPGSGIGTEVAKPTDTQPGAKTETTPIVTPVPSKLYAPSTVEDIKKEKTTLLNTPTELAPNPKAAGSIRNIPIKTAQGTLNLTYDTPINNQPTPYDVARATFGIPKEKFIPIKPAVTKLYKLLEEPQKGWFGKYDAEQEDRYTESVNSIKNYMGELEYNSTPNSKLLYNENTVAEHNALVDRFNALLMNPRESQGLLSAMYAKYDISTLVHVNNPQELCTVLNSGKYSKAITSLVDEVGSTVKGTNKASLQSGNVSEEYKGLLND